MLFEELKSKYLGYLEAISNIGFSISEYRDLPKEINTEADLIKGLCAIIDTSKELNLIIEQSPASIYVADTKGKTLRVNQAFKRMTGLAGESLLGRTTESIEKEELFQPSVCTIALKEEKRVILPQVVNGDREFVVTGVPILNEYGEIFRVITNALLNNDIKNISSYFEDIKSNPAEVKMSPALIAVSEGMQNVIKLADLIKDTQSTILIEGETGVGKTLLARHIHYTGQRKDRKMTEINCGAIPQALLESELFGYEGGAFTGADKKGKAGLIEISNGGTILLDEISELPTALQVKLLHFLQNKKITRVGGTEEISVDVRVIAATNKTLENMVEAGEFREDLYYRLNVVPIIIPPLRERKADIMPAVNYFVEKFTTLYNKKLKIEDKCVDFFVNSYWKGNMRELENCVERLVVTEGEGDFGAGLIWRNRTDAESDVAANQGTDTKPKKIDEMEKQLVVDAYYKYKSSYRVAKELGISQSTAYRKIKKYITES